MPKRSLIRDRMITIFLIALIILLALGIINQTHPLGFNFLGLNLSQAPTPVTLQQTPVSGMISSTKPYTAEIPGPGCNSDTALWSGGTQHHEKNGDVDDPNTSFICKKNGLLIVRFAPYDVFGTAFFSNPAGEPLANNYRVQVTAQIINGDPNATIELGVHGQSHYGSDSIEVSSDGNWSEGTYDNATGTNLHKLISGTLARPPATVTIIAEVHGANVSATINGVKMKTVKDPDYSTTSYIDFGIADVGAAHSPEALFSHFVYTPQG